MAYKWLRSPVTLISIRYLKFRESRLRSNFTKEYQRIMCSYLIWPCLLPKSMKAITLNPESILCTITTERLKFPKFETRECASVVLPVRFQSFTVSLYRAVCSFYLHCILYMYLQIYEGGSKSYRTDQLFKMTEIKQICYF